MKSFETSRTCRNIFLLPLRFLLSWHRLKKVMTPEGHHVGGGEGSRTLVQNNFTTSFLQWIFGVSSPTHIGSLSLRNRRLSLNAFLPLAWQTRISLRGFYWVLDLPGLLGRCHLSSSELTNKHVVLDCKRDVSTCADFVCVAVWRCPIFKVDTGVHPIAYFAVTIAVKTDHPQLCGTFYFLPIYFTKIIFFRIFSIVARKSNLLFSRPPRSSHFPGPSRGPSSAASH